jgi:hypothetical protein
MIETKLRYLIHSSETFSGYGICMPSADTIKNKIVGVYGGLLERSSLSNNKRSTRLPSSISSSCEYQGKSNHFSIFENRICVIYTRENRLSVILSLIQ